LVVRYFVGVGLGIPTIYVFRFLKGIHHFDMQQSRGYCPRTMKRSAT
jgi:hypothetical protein